jgi:peptidoglycan/xylan/chitin deacetylase (PgdA/CDA1 family)
MRLFVSVVAAALLLAGAADAGPMARLARQRGGGLVEPSLHIAPGGPGGPRVALTFDACMGRTDMRILSTLLANRVPATIFVTGRWLKRNRPAFAEMRAHPDLFEIENHGLNHVPAVDRPMRIYGIPAAGSSEAVRAEVEGGAKAITDAGAPRPQWYRDATAKYTATAAAQIRAMGFRIAGYSVNGDGGSLLGAAGAERQFGSARDGDVVIAHINQPTHKAGEGVVKGILDLKAKGYTFVRLSDVAATGSDGTTGAVMSSAAGKAPDGPAAPKKG